MLFTAGMGYVVPAGVFNEVLANCRHIAEYPREGGLWVSEMAVKLPEPPGDKPRLLPGNVSPGGPQDLRYGSHL